MTDPKIRAQAERSTIKRLNEFGEGFRHRHEDYRSDSILSAIGGGGVWKNAGYTFYFPEHFGFCYGVDKAIDLTFEACVRFKHRRIFLTDQLIHNPYINRRLKEKGVRYLKRNPNSGLLICSGLKAEDVVVVSAFGTDFRDIQNLRKKSVTVVDTTCGAIINVWKRVEGYARDGFITVMHGRRSHEETRATVSQAIKEGGSYLIVETPAEAQALARVIRGRLGIGEFIRKYPGCAPKKGFSCQLSDCKMGMANQTTMLKEQSIKIQSILRKAFVARFGAAAAEGRFRNFQTICAATQDRQNALRKLMRRPLDLMLIVGGFNSSNTTHLAEIASAQKRFAVYHIESAADLLGPDRIRFRDPADGCIRMKKGWFRRGLRRIGLTSGASTPDVMLAEVVEAISGI